MVEALARLPVPEQVGLLAVEVRWVLAVGVWRVVAVVLCCVWGGMISIATPVELYVCV